MKLAVNTFAVLLISGFPLFVEAQTLEESLKNTYLQMDSAKTLPDMMRVSAQFDMIADKWNNEWSSNYSAALVKAIISFMEPDNKRKDLLLDEADRYLEKVKSLGSKDDETWVLAALITNARIAVDGQNRGMQYGGVFNQYIEKARSINPDNPRIYYLKGSSLFYQPEMFGGGKEKAKPYLEKARELFGKEAKGITFKPRWGEKQNQDLLDQCN
ncbi:MAG: hypothetical protein Q8868_12365 [Bacteroidota bacterium]|nr:hypothetical protein [Bacteroidota bacterium]